MSRECTNVRTALERIRELICEGFGLPYHVVKLISAGKWHYLIISTRSSDTCVELLEEIDRELLEEGEIRSLMADFLIFSGGVEEQSNRYPLGDIWYTLELSNKVK